MNCPRCHNPLAHESYEGVTIDRCAVCHGAWLDEGELPQIVNTRTVKFPADLIKSTLAAAFAGVTAPELHSIEKCPKCQTAMTAANFSYSSGVILDRCPKGHGVWLDGGELSKAQLHKEHWSTAVDENRKSWEDFARATLDTQRALASQKRKEGLGPASYLVNSLIRKMVGG